MLVALRHCHDQLHGRADANGTSTVKLSKAAVHPQTDHENTAAINVNSIPTSSGAISMSITFSRLADLGVTPVNDDPAYKKLIALDLPDEVLGMAAQLLGYLMVAVTPNDIHYEEGKGVGFAQGLSFAGALDSELEDELKQVFRQAAKRRLDQ